MTRQENRRHFTASGFLFLAAFSTTHTHNHIVRAGHIAAGKTPGTCTGRTAVGTERLALGTCTGHIAVDMEHRAPGTSCTGCIAASTKHRALGACSGYIATDSGIPAVDTESEGRAVPVAEAIAPQEASPGRLDFGRFRSPF